MCQTAIVALKTVKGSELRVGFVPTEFATFGIKRDHQALSRFVEEYICDQRVNGDCCGSKSVWSLLGLWPCGPGRGVRL